VTVCHPIDFSPRGPFQPGVLPATTMIDGDGDGPDHLCMYNPAQPGRLLTAVGGAGCLERQVLTSMPLSVRLLWVPAGGLHQAAADCLGQN